MWSLLRCCPRRRNGTVPETRTPRPVFRRRRCQLQLTRIAARDPVRCAAPCVALHEELTCTRSHQTEEALKRLSERPQRRRQALARGDAGDEERAGGGRSAESCGVPTDDGQPLALFAPGRIGGT